MIARNGAEPVDVTTWHALQTWLAGAEHRVAIPYAERLVDLIPPLAVRMRRDVKALFNLISAHAILHQATRERDPDGQVVATLADYTVVRLLVADLFAQGADASVPPTVRETVEVVRDLVLNDLHTTVTGHQVARALQIDKSAASRRLRDAVARSYLVNLEEKRGRPMQIVLGEPLPDEIVILPTPEELDEASCAVAREAEGDGTPDPARRQTERRREKSPF
jgi:hypothetical protein